MTKKEFLTELKSLLIQISEDERKDIMQDFEEHFQIGLEEGETEEEIASGLGSPEQIAKELLATYHIEKMETTASAGNMLRSVWAVISLCFFNLIIVLGPFIAVASVLLGGWILSLTFVASPILVILNGLVHPSLFEVFELFVSMILAGIGLFV